MFKEGITKSYESPSDNSNELNQALAEKVHRQCNQEHILKLALRAKIEKAFRNDGECQEIADKNLVYISMIGKEHVKTAGADAFKQVREKCENYFRVSKERTHECLFLISGLKEMFKGGKMAKNIQSEEKRNRHIALIAEEINKQCNQKFVDRKTTMEAIQANFEGDGNCLLEVKDAFLYISGLEKQNAKVQGLEFVKGMISSCEKVHSRKRDKEAEE